VGAEPFGESQQPTLGNMLFAKIHVILLFSLSLSLIILNSIMKTITLEVSDELADKFNTLEKMKREMMLKFLVDRMTDSSSLSDLLAFSAEQAKQQGMTDGILKQLLKKE
jgi:hypothetical protein